MQSVRSYPPLLRDDTSLNRSCVPSADQLLAIRSTRSFARVRSRFSGPVPSAEPLPAGLARASRSLPPSKVEGHGAQRPCVAVDQMPRRHVVRVASSNGQHLRRVEMQIQTAICALSMPPAAVIV